MIEYQNPFYNVFRINADTPNEYYRIDDKKQYTINTVPTSPFNMDKSSFEQLQHYKSQYIGNNSNTSHLILVEAAIQLHENIVHSTRILNKKSMIMSLYPK